ncbi:polysaccharide lyase family 7 protein [Neiella marina]|uniref:Polysaccharide lyase family 7 protein n=1 Tax=Neiella holothuriorum TaxID=2870530 RepID=A0ABS7EJP1_9GAMM|nr:polysaccharide lyase family 7 protein [Neiella holothuriorum]MBW8192510.1 polysaccharide lyase family 7 protein [Neiella holothuriorum]
MNSNTKLFATLVIALLSCAQIACSGHRIESSNTVSPAALPAQHFDLSHWKLTVPLDENNDGKVDEITVAQLQSYAHADFFYLDEDGYMVFAASNNAMRTANSTNTRSELRQMLRGTNEQIDTHSPLNNFALAAHPQAAEFAAIGGKMLATLKVNHVALRTGKPHAKSAHAVVIGQIHAGKMKDKRGGFGWGNEPLKIFYKKFPNHNTGSVYWTYERNLARGNKARRDIAYPVWGNGPKNRDNPGEDGIRLGESFSYEVNVDQNIMQLTFSAEGKPEIHYQIDLSNNVNAYGDVDDADHPQGYSGDFLYFKAGAYNQCSQAHQQCPGTGDWATDKANGDYVNVAFSKLELSEATPIPATN